MYEGRPRLSVIIATFNAAATLPRCLASLQCQDFRDFELLVADGGSSDGTVDIIRAHAAHITYWQSHPDSGIYDAWNQALAHADGEYICFLGADDALHGPGVLGELFNRIGAESFDLVSSLGQLRDSDWNPVSRIGTAWRHATLPRRLGVCHPGLLHHRSLFDRYGAFDVRYRIAADLEFFLRLDAGTRAIHLSKVTVDVGGAGISRQHFWRRLRERRNIHAECPRVGQLMAWTYWADKAWRRPIARVFGIPH